MNKEIAWGHWYPMKKGTFPEDLLGYKTYDKYDITPNVLIPCCLFCSRIRKRGGRWEWWPNPKVKPLFWMPIPKIKTKFTSCPR